MLGRFRSHLKKICWHVNFKRVSRPFDCCKLDLMGHRWPKLWRLKMLVLMKICVYIHFEIWKIKFMAIARASRPKKQGGLKLRTHLAFTWHTPKISSLVLWNARVTIRQSFSYLERVNPAETQSGGFIAALRYWAFVCVVCGFEKPRCSSAEFDYIF